MEDPPVPIEPYDEATARQVLLARAVEEADPDGRIVGPAERDAIEQEVLGELRSGAAGTVHRGDFLRLRAQRLLAVVAKRQPAIAALQHAGPWERWLGWVLPVGACFVGAVLDRIDNPQHVNMLSPPLLGVLAWNLVAYLVLAAGALGLWRNNAVLPLAEAAGNRLARWGRPGRLRMDVSARFQALWLGATGRRQAWRLQEVLHWTAAGWALGLALSIVIGGLVRQYRVGWESTLLDPGAVHALLSALFWPVVALLPFDGFSTADLQRMAFSAQPPAGVLEARRWVWMYLALLALVVIAPRILLALWARWRRRHAGPVPVDLSSPFMADLLARALPGRITLGMAVADADAADTCRRLFQQLAPGRPPGAGQSWRIVDTPAGDRLEVVELPAAAAGPQPGVDVVLRSGPGRTELQLVAGGSPAPAPSVAWRELRGALDDAALLDALLQALPPARRPAFERIARSWRQRREDIRAAGMEVLAGWLVRAARDTQMVALGPSGLRRLLDPAQWEQTRQDRAAAAGALLDRLQASEREAAAELLRLYAAPPARAGTGVPASVAQVQWKHGMDSPQAGVMGAASGAAMGLGVDAALGGMTLGAAAALGALIGGTVGLTAAVRKNKASPEGQSLVQWGDDVLQTLAEHAVLAFLAAARRDPASQAEAAAPAWRSEVVAAVEHRSEVLAALWAQARASDDPAAAQAVAQELDQLARTVDARL